MAVPVVASVGTYLTGATSTTANFAVPTGVAANDIVVVVMYSEASAEPGLPSGFARLVRVSAPDHQLFVAWKRATSADTGTYDFTQTNAWREGYAIRITGCPTTGDPYELTATATGSGTTTPVVAATTTLLDDLLLWMSTAFNASTWTQPAGWTEIVDQGAQGAAWINWPTVTATGGITGANTGGGNTTAALIAFKAVVSVLDQDAYRWGLDDGIELVHGWAAAEDTPITVAAGQRRLLRVQVEETAGVDHTGALTLQFKRSDEAADQWRDL